MKIVLFFFVLSNISIASDTAIKSAARKEVKSFLALIKHVDKKKLGFNPKETEISEDKFKGDVVFGDSMEYLRLFKADVNNDGNSEYLVTYSAGGSTSSSGVMCVVTKDAKVIEFDNVVSWNLWTYKNGDMSKFHGDIAKPFIVKRKNKIILRFLDLFPKKKVQVIEYLWSMKSFKKI